MTSSHDSHHSFSVELASEHSIEEAIMIHHFQHWCNVNARKGTNFHDGKTWTYETIEGIKSHFPYWSSKQVERLLVKLTSKKILIKGNYNKSAYDRTVWYAFSDEIKYSISRNREMDFPKSGNGFSEIGRPIPDTKTDTKTDTSTAPEAPADVSSSESAKTESRKVVTFDKTTASFTNLTEADKARWKALCPSLDIEAELAHAAIWLSGTTKKYTNIAGFLTNWMKRASEKPRASAPSKDRTGQSGFTDDSIYAQPGFFK